MAAKDPDPKAAEPAAAPARDYPVLSRLKVRRRIYAAGETVTLTDEETAGVPAGVIGEPVKAKKSAPAV